MSLAKITYSDKVALNQNSSIPDINKVNFSDMNEIKSVVNGLIDTLDYEIGTFTPYLEGDTNPGTASYLFRDGNYVRIGKCLFYNYRIGSDSFTGSSGLLLIRGLPNYSYKEPGANSVVFSKSTTFFGNKCCVNRVYGKNLIIDGGDLSNVSNANWTDNTYIYGSGVLIIE